MPNSLAERPSFNCPECGQVFNPEIWLIIDVDERPDLLEKARQGIIHHVLCPKGHTSLVDSPLLFFRRGESPPLIFSPSFSATQEQTQKAAKALLNRLIDSMGSSWQNEWIDQAVRVKRELLGYILAESNQEQSEAPPLYHTYMQRAIEAEKRHQVTGNLAALDESISYWNHIVYDSGFVASPDSFRLSVLNNTAGVLLRRYWVGGQRQTDLERSIQLWSAALIQAPESSEARIAIQNNLSVSLRERFRQLDQIEDLEASIAASEFVLANTPAASPHRASRLSNLGDSLRLRFEKTGQVDYLREALASHQEAVNLTPEESPTLPGHLNNLALCLSDHYGLFGDEADLQGAIDALQKAVWRPPIESQDKIIFQNNLALALKERYISKGEVKDLDEAIAIWDDVLTRMPDDNPEKEVYQTNLGLAIYDKLMATK